MMATVTRVPVLVCTVFSKQSGVGGCFCACARSKKRTFFSVSRRRHYFTTAGNNKNKSSSNSISNKRFSATATQKSTPPNQKAAWPPSFQAFVTGTPIVTRKLPYLGHVTIDFGTTMLNFGAITSLTGFMMTDVLKLRSLSIVGSVSGIIYNMTRTPKQLNAVAWGGVFISVNVVQIIRLLMERKEIKFNVEEANLYYRRFQPHGVTPIQFQKLMQRFGKWKTYDAGRVLVEDGKPLEEVIIVTDGKATAISPTTDKPLFPYSSEQDHGQIIGATGIVDPTIVGSPYPHRIVADEKTRTVVFPTKKVQAFLQDDNASLMAAILHMMYVDFQRSVNRRPSSDDEDENNESNKTNNKKIKSKDQVLHELKILLQMACASGAIHPEERSIIHDFMKQNKNTVIIDESQFLGILQSKEVGNWTLEEWKDGKKATTKLLTNDGHEDNTAAAAEAEPK